MSPPGRLHLPRVRGAPLLFLLGLLLALLPPGAQGLPGTGLPPSAARMVNQPSYGPLKPAAHLIGDSGTRDSLRWRVGRDMAFLRGFSFSNDSLLIPASGLYFVYSQVVFSGLSCSLTSTPNYLYLTHEVRLLTSQYGSPLTLLSTQKSQKSVCPGPQDPWVRSMYQGAVFLLRQGDRLFTYTEGIHHLLLSPSTVFFGAFAV
ncbi:Lymphotoxin-alpha [Heterocephalus glaber]|uniref:Lymphotoxin-alpha n=1 Tax=Heterocephalus glaber TaxID=10181 RepID=G5C3E1_HETGA|nr:lymphotoxin-alpha [Heterocephalus glaber]EHB16052.1 Lymphotoxin-alpha [Heterocephalus glaber]